MVKAEQKCLLVQQGKRAASSAAQAVLHLFNRSVGLEEVQKSHPDKLMGREKKSIKNPHLEPETGLLMLKSCKKH